MSSEQRTLTTLIALRTISETDGIALYEAVMIARDPAHPPWGNSGDTLRRYALIDRDGKMHGTTRNTILSAVKGDDLTLRIESPLPVTPPVCPGGNITPAGEE